MDRRVHSQMNGYHTRDLHAAAPPFSPDYPHSNSNPLFTTTNIGLNHPQQSSHPSHLLHNNQWPNANMQPNHQMPSQLPSHFNQQQPQFNPGWMNQFSSGMTAMGFNPLFQHQLFQDALAMSQPVEAADEPLLVQVLLSAKKKKESYKDALNGLHGKNGHSASLWKDYYLDHKDHIDTWINMCLEKEKSQSVDKDTRHISRPHDRRPLPHTIKREFSPGRIPVSAPPASKKRKHSTPSTGATPVPTTGRSTLNSLSVPKPVFNDQMPAPHSELEIPDPPSRSPSPPTRVIPQGRGNKYTEQDRQFFLKFISWRLKQDASLTRNDLCNMLAEKAPHHTAQSWASHWSNRHDLPDKILAAARGESYVSDEDEDDDDDEPEQVRPTKRRPRYRESSTEDDNEEEDNNSEEEGEEGEHDQPVKRYTESQMGQKGEPFTEADLYMAAKHAAKYDDWLEMTSKDRWEPFAQKFAQRSAKSWAEYYRRSEDNILRLRKKMRKGTEKGTVPGRCAPVNQPSERKPSNSDSEESDADVSQKDSRSSSKGT